MLICQHTPLLVNGSFYLKFLFLLLCFVSEVGHDITIFLLALSLLNIRQKYHGMVCGVLNVLLLKVDTFL